MSDFSSTPQTPSLTESQTKPMAFEITDLEREKQLYLYASALENGDWETINRVLDLAARDAKLESFIHECNENWNEEIEAQADAQSSTTVRDIAQRVFSQPEEDEEIELASITISSVAGRIKSDVAQGLRRADRETLSLLEKLRAIEVPVPQNLNRSAVKNLFVAVGVDAGERFLKQFRDTALMLVMGQQQGRAQLAATRRQREAARPSHDDSASPPPKEETP